MVLGDYALNPRPIGTENNQMSPVPPHGGVRSRRPVAPARHSTPSAFASAQALETHRALANPHVEAPFLACAHANAYSYATVLMPLSLLDARTGRPPAVSFASRALCSSRCAE